MNTSEIQRQLFEKQDIKYRDFQAKLMPTVDAQTVIGVRTPILRGLAKALYNENNYADFLRDLPHKYFEENQLHAFLISEMRELEPCMDALNRFLPYVDNWATCDQMSPRIFKKHKGELSEQIKIWISSPETYTVRFAVGMLMRHYLDEDFAPEYPRMISAIRSEEYYVGMMVAWYFATALAKRYEEILPFLEEKRLDRRTHNKAIQKALESYRISEEQKRYLRTLKI